MNRERGGVYPHPSFEQLHKEKGSGWYIFNERVGLGGIFRLTSTGAIPFSPRDDGPDVHVHDIYDVLRAVEEGRIFKLERGAP